MPKIPKHHELDQMDAYRHQIGLPSLDIRRKEVVADDFVTLLRSTLRCLQASEKDRVELVWFLIRQMISKDLFFMSEDNRMNLLSWLQDDLKQYDFICDEDDCDYLDDSDFDEIDDDDYCEFEDDCEDDGESVACIDDGNWNCSDETWS